MSNYLLQINVGPVQGFIAAARRTRDLWFGSYMLSELSKAAAASLMENGGSKVDLIFPAPEDPADLTEGSDFNVANVILAEVNDAEPDFLNELAEKAHKAVQKRFESFAKQTFNQFSRQEQDLIDRTLMWKQLKDVIEFYAAWTILEDNYKTSRRELTAILSARKSLRDFEANPITERGPKSSLDGLRESVLKLGHSAMYMIKENEALDAVGLIKRFAEHKDFPSVMRVAIDPWVRGHESLVKTIKELPLPFKSTTVCEWLVQNNALSRTAKKGTDDPLYGSFPYDGSALYVSRHAALAEEAVKAQEQAKKALALIEKELRDALKNKEPLPDEPYFVVLQADGDHMGRMILHLDTADKNREFSKCLASFALAARETVKKHHGACVYTGGDDVLAFLPLDTALQCARALHKDFTDCLKPVEQYAPSGETMTLSVGISIASAQEDLEFLREWGSSAEKLAKNPTISAKKLEKNDALKNVYGDRNGLAVTLRTRGNGEVTVRERWRGKASEFNYETFSLTDCTPLDARLRWWAECFKRDVIPARFPYELREAARFYEQKWSDRQRRAQAACDDALRIFSRKGIVFEPNDKVMNKKRVDMVRHYVEERLRDDSEEMMRLADELIIAKWIGDAERAADPVRHARKGESA